MQCNVGDTAQGYCINRADCTGRSVLKVDYIMRMTGFAAKVLQLRQYCFAVFFNASHQGFKQFKSFLPLLIGGEIRVSVVLVIVSSRPHWDEAAPDPVLPFFPESPTDILQHVVCWRLPAGQEKRSADRVLF